MTLTVSDPWEFMQWNGGSLVACRLVEGDSKDLLLRAHVPVEAWGTTSSWLLAVARHSDRPLGVLSGGGRIAVGGYLLPESEQWTLASARAHRHRGNGFLGSLEVD